MTLNVHTDVFVI